MTTKLALGTANFGLTYGIANNRMLSEKEAFAILEKAIDVGVCCVDTARGYGNAEKVLGGFLKAHGKVFDVVTKLPDGEYRFAEDVERQIKTSLENLGIERIDTLLLHSFRSFERFSDVLLPVFERYRSAGIIGGYGLSVYHPYEIEMALRAGFHVAAVQFPLNLFDQRFLKDGYLQKLGASGITLYGRSIFLQGLFFMDEGSLGGHFEQAKPKLKHLASLASMHGMSVEALALLFALSSGADYVVLGVDSPAQLERNAAIMAKDTASLLPRLKGGFQMLEISDEDIILPYRWKQ
ncbi:MAG TPA: aldo/keto reductase [Syntrophorhabdales bacterium]|nr:aldo/keto reductase [Syntrophorhabdales bacterium]